MKFTIIVSINDKNYRMQVERIYESGQVYRYKVSGGNKEIILQTTAPQWIKKGFHHYRGTWKLYDGKTYDEASIKAITDTIDSYILSIEEKAKPPYIHPKNKPDSN
jgi:hypothetical protein